MRSRLVTAVLFLCLFATAAAAGTTFIHVETEGWGEIRAAEAGDPGPADGRASNGNGATVWDGTRWVINNTWAHKYFMDSRTGLRLKEYTTYAIDPSPAALGEQPAVDGHTVTKRIYSYAVPSAVSGAAGLFETYLYDAVEYEIAKPDGVTLVRSRGTGQGTAAGVLDAFFETDWNIANEPVFTTAVRGDPVVYLYPGIGAAEAAERTDPVESRVAFVLQSFKPLAPPGGEVWFDIGGGSDLGPAGIGRSWFFKLTPMAPPLVATIEPSGAFVTEFRHKWMDSSGNLQQIVVTPSIAAERKVSVRRSYLLPKSIAVTPAGVKFSGTLDTGPAAPDFTGAATLHVGGAEFAIPAWTAKGRRRSYAGGGIDVKLSLPRTATSRCGFRLTLTGAAAQGIDPGRLDLRLETPSFDGAGSALLRSGKFALSRKPPGSVVTPGLYVLAARARLSGRGSDSLKLKLGFPAPAVWPATGDVEVRFAGRVVAKVPAASFKARRNVRSHRGAGISVAVDLAKETLALSASRLDLGALPQGPQPVLVVLKLGDIEPPGAEIRMTRKGKSLTY